jgi:hypothetical protein
MRQVRKDVIEAKKITKLTGESQSNSQPVMQEHNRSVLGFVRPPRTQQTLSRDMLDSKE